MATTLEQQHYERIIDGLQERFRGLVDTGEPVYPITICAIHENGLYYPADKQEQIKTGDGKLRIPQPEQESDSFLPLLLYGNGSAYLNERIQTPNGFLGETVEVLIHIVINDQYANPDYDTICDLNHEDYDENYSKLDPESPDYTPNCGIQNLSLVKTASRVHEAVRMVVAGSQRVGNLEGDRKHTRTTAARLRRKFVGKSRRHANREFHTFSIEVDRIYRRTN